MVLFLKIYELKSQFLLIFIIFLCIIYIFNLLTVNFMSSVDNNFFNEVKFFANDHKILCVLTLGLALAVYSLGNLAGRTVSWIIECCGTTQRTDILARERLSTSVNESPISIQSTETVFSQEIDSIKISFSAFKLELEEQIFPFYERHEAGFDRCRVHGRMHAARAIIFGEVMARYYQSQGQFVDFDYVRRTIGLHDAGRKGNGIDRWERESAEILCNYLISKNMPEEEARKKSNVVVKEDADKDSIAFKIFQSADCLDIMRPCTGWGGRKGFNSTYLTFLKNSTNSKESQFRRSLIEEAWFFIQITEEQKMTKFNESKGFMDKLLEVIEEHQAELPILSSILK